MFLTRRYPGMPNGIMEQKVSKKASQSPLAFTAQPLPSCLAYSICVLRALEVWFSRKCSNLQGVIEASGEHIRAIPYFTRIFPLARRVPVNRIELHNPFSA